MFQHILLAVDRNDAAEVATSFTVGLARSNAASVHVLHVNQFLVGGRGHTALTQREADDLVLGVLGELWAAGIDATASVVRATAQHMASAVADAALSQGADVIALGRSRRHRLPRLTRGLRERITDLSGIAVVVAPPPLAASKARVSARSVIPPELSLGARRTQ